MRTILAIIASIALAACLQGCAGMSQAIAAKAQSDKVAVEAANDGIVAAIKDAIVALPYGALVRHPEMQSCAKSIAGATGQVDLFALPAAATATP